MQLEACLRSFFLYAPKEFGNVLILWTSSKPEFKKGYEKVIKQYKKPNVSFVEEEPTKSSFKQNVQQGFIDENPMSMFLVDDIIFKAPFSFDDLAFKTVLEDPEVLCLSLRLWIGIDYCYPTKMQIRFPTLEHSNGFVKFNWKGAEGDWGYPMSIDGHVFKTPLLKKVVEVLDFHNPNGFEGAMSHMANLGFLNHLPKMACYGGESKLLNIPANRVQDVVMNRHGNLITPEDLNTQFLQGKRINVEAYKGFPNRSPHIELHLRME